MAIDLRQEEQQRQQQEQPGARRPRRGTVWTVAAALIAVIAVGAAFTVLILQDDPAPATGISLTYPEGADTADREGGTTIVVPEPATEITDTSVGTREGGSY